MENKFSKVKAVQDDSCHWHLIPNALCEEFYQDSLNEEFIESGRFSEKWSQYSTDGDLNNVQLWIEELTKSRYSWDKFPKWVKYVAIDKRGDMFGYEEEPKRHYRGYWAKCDGKSCLLENVGPFENWKDSLEQRPETLSTEEKKYEVHQASEDYIKHEISPSHFTLINRSYENFLKCYNDTAIPPSHLEGFIEFMVEAATPSLTLPQYIRLKIIEYWKEAFAEYPQVITRLEKIR